MVEDSEIAELSEVYREMGSGGKKNIVKMAEHLLNAQQIGKGKDGISNDMHEKNLNMADEEIAV